jgi:hypothetical protein
MQTIRVKTLGPSLGAALQAAESEPAGGLAAVGSGMKVIGIIAGAILLWVAFSEARSRTR